MHDKLKEMKKLADEKLQAEKDRLRSSRHETKLRAEIKRARELVKKDFSGFDPIFSFGILTQLSLLKSANAHDVDDTMKLAFERSILKTVSPGNYMEMCLVTQAISVHQASMNCARLLAHAKTRDEIESYGNIFNKLARTFASLTEALQRLRSGPEPKLTVNNLSVNQGGRAIVGPVTHTAVGTSQEATAPRLVTDQSGAAMRIIESDDTSATVPRVEEGQEGSSNMKKQKWRP